MNEQDYQAAVAAGQVKVVQPQEQLPLDTQKITSSGLDEFLPIIYKILRPRRHLTSAPTFTPKTWTDAIQFYDDGVNRRIYLYINGTWRSATLT